MHGGRPLLLLAEDDENFSMLFERLVLQIEPRWNVKCVPNGLHAIQHCMERGNPHILVTDLKMPQMGGLELIQWFRAQPNSFRTPVLVYSSSDDNETLEHCRSAGANELVSKAASSQQVQKVVRRYMDDIE